MTTLLGQRGQNTNRSFSFFATTYALSPVGFVKAVMVLQRDLP